MNSVYKWINTHDLVKVSFEIDQNDEKYYFGSTLKIQMRSDREISAVYKKREDKFDIDICVPIIATVNLHYNNIPKSDSGICDILDCMYEYCIKTFDTVLTQSISDLT